MIFELIVLELVLDIAELDCRRMQDKQKLIFHAGDFVLQEILE